jgi:hypothetical protein
MDLSLLLLAHSHCTHTFAQNESQCVFCVTLAVHVQQWCKVGALCCSDIEYHNDTWWNDICCICNYVLFFATRAFEDSRMLCKIYPSLGTAQSVCGLEASKQWAIMQHGSGTCNRYHGRRRQQYFVLLWQHRFLHRTFMQINIWCR